MTRSHKVVPHDGSDMAHSGSFLITLAGAASWEESDSLPIIFLCFLYSWISPFIGYQKLLHIHQFIRLSLGNRSGNFRLIWKINSISHSVVVVLCLDQTNASHCITNTTELGIFLILILDFSKKKFIHWIISCPLLLAGQHKTTEDMKSSLWILTIQKMQITHFRALLLSKPVVWNRQLFVL